jgi:hypothetical protein
MDWWISGIVDWWIVGLVDLKGPMIAIWKSFHRRTDFSHFTV